MYTVKRLKNMTPGPIDLNVGNGKFIRLFGKSKKRPGNNISRPVDASEIKSQDVKVNVKAGAIQVITEEVY
jgi:hypothetical protein